jgi:hypothetical protein
VTRATAIASWAARNDTEAAEADGEVIDAALIYAFDYMNQKYRLRWRGSKVEAFQYADWPRSGVAIPDFFDPYYRNINVPFNFRHTVFWEPDVIPPEVQTAQILLARASITSSTESGSLETSLGRTTKREKLGGLEVEYFGVEGGGQRQTTLYWDADKVIQPYLQPAHSGMVVRS